MSEDVAAAGTLTVATKDEIVEFLKEEDPDYNKYVLYKGTYYKVNKVDLDPYDGIFLAEKLPDNKIRFFVRYYNGGLGLGEAIETALKGLPDEQDNNKT